MHYLAAIPLSISFIVLSQRSLLWTAEYISDLCKTRPRVRRSSHSSEFQVLREDEKQVKLASSLSSRISSPSRSTNRTGVCNIILHTLVRHILIFRLPLIAFRLQCHRALLSF